MQAYSLIFVGAKISMTWHTPGNEIKFSELVTPDGPYRSMQWMPPKSSLLEAFLAKKKLDPVVLRPAIDLESPIHEQRHQGSWLLLPSKALGCNHRHGYPSPFYLRQNCIQKKNVPLNAVRVKRPFSSEWDRF
jgi:hypothetical protein